MTVIDLATPKLAELDDARSTIERLAAANQLLTQRLDREHSMRLAAEERVASILDIPILSFGEPLDLDPITLNDVKITVANIEGAIECIEEIERRAHEAEAALEALRADVERDRSELASFAEVLWSFDGGEASRLWDAAPSPADALAVAAVCELLAAWGRAQDVEHCRETRRQAALFHRSAKEAIERATDALYGRAP